MMAYLILSVIILAGGGISFLWIKKLRNDKKALEFKLNFAENQIHDLQENAKHYKTIIDKVNHKDKESDDVKKKIDSASGSALADLANSL